MTLPQLCSLLKGPSLVTHAKATLMYKRQEPQAFGIIRKKTYAPEVVAAQAEMLSNRVKKTFRRLAPGFEKRQIGVFRLYDWDIPEIRAVVDWYEGHLVVGEYVREQTEGINWLETMGEALAKAFKLSPDKIHLRRRSTRPKTGERYQRLAETGERLVVREGDLRFWVDLDSFLDTGLFADHRETRSMVRKEAQGKDVLNLFAYTGAFTIHAVAGGARSTCSVDRSQRYLDWAQENMKLNEFSGWHHQFLAEDVRPFLRNAARRAPGWDLIVLDPPSFSTRGDEVEFDVQFDHRELIQEALAVLRPGGTLYFSTNHQRFDPEFEDLPRIEVEEITDETLPIDYERSTPHRAFRITHS